MHSYITNASLQIVPVVNDKHPYEWVDEAIGVIKNSGIKYEVDSFATVIEGTYDEIMEVINEVNEYLLAHNCAEWICNIQLQIRSKEDITGYEKTRKYFEPL